MHWNRTAYPSPNVAAGHGDGLTGKDIWGHFQQLRGQYFTQFCPPPPRVDNCGHGIYQLLANTYPLSCDQAWTFS